MSETSPGKRKVFHLIRNYLLRTETFIYSQVRSTPGYQSWVMARNHREGESELFPLQNLRIYTRDSPSSMSFHWGNVNYRFIKRMTRAEIAFYCSQINEVQPHLLHIHYGPDARYFLPVVKRTSLPTIVSFYGFDASSFPKRHLGLGTIYLRKMFHGVQRVLAMSEDMKEDLIRIGCPSGIVRIHHPNGVDLKAFPFCERSARPPSGKCVLLNIAAFEARKGQQDLLKAFSFVIRSFPDAELRIAGEGPLRKDIEQTVHSLQLQGHVTLLGHLPYDRLPSELSRADIFCHPSVTSGSGDKEGIPTIIVEAAATGLPVVATDHAGIPEAVKHGETGFLVDEGDWKALAERILTLLENPPLRVSMGTAGRNHIQEHFEISKLREQRRTIYDELLESCSH